MRTPPRPRPASRLRWVATVAATAVGLHLAGWAYRSSHHVLVYWPYELTLAVAALVYGAVAVAVPTLVAPALSKGPAAAAAAAVALPSLVATAPIPPLVGLEWAPAVQVGACAVGALAAVATAWSTGPAAQVPTRPSSWARHWHGSHEVSGEPSRYQ